MNTNEMYDVLIDLGVSKEGVDIVTNINGYNKESMQDILYVVTGYRNFEQLKEEEQNDL